MDGLDYDMVQQQKTKTKFRRYSVSMDIEFPDFVERLPVYYKKQGSYNKIVPSFYHKIQNNLGRFRAFSTNFFDRNKCFYKSEISLYQFWGKAELKLKPEIFPFQSLPDDCKLLVFSKLSLKEKGICCQVCWSWNKMLLNPITWSNIDFNSFPLCDTCPELNRDCTLLCYNSYKKRIQMFIKFLVNIKPCIFSLKFSFDIGDPKDKWLPHLERLFKFSNCQNLRILDINWKDTPAKLLIPTKSSTTTWSYTDYKNYKFDFRHRYRLFTSFFDQITICAPNIQSLTLPFYFSDRNLASLCRLRSLKKLDLKLYFWMQDLHQSHLSLLLKHLELHSLTIEVWVPTGPGFHPYNLKSTSLTFLDISPSRGIYLQKVLLPKLKHLKVSQHPLFPPFNKMEKSLTLACLHSSLKNGAPSLLSLNNVTLTSDWKDHPNEELEEMLKEVCCCRKHR